MLSLIVRPVLLLLSLSLKIYTYISATISGLWHWKVQVNDYHAWNRICTNHTFLVGFHMESWGLIPNTNWNCHHNLTMSYALVRCDAFSLLEYVNWKFLRILLLLFTLALREEKGWETLGEVSTPALLTRVIIFF